MTLRTALPKLLNSLAACLLALCVCVTASGASGTILTNVEAAKDTTAHNLEASIANYLNKQYPCSITKVTFKTNEVRIDGDLGVEKGNLVVVEVPMSDQVTQTKEFAVAVPIDHRDESSFTVVLPSWNASSVTSRLLSRWAVARKTENGFELLSHIRYADTVEARAPLPELKPRNKKGIGGYSAGRQPQSDLDDLDISAVTVNIGLSHFMRNNAGPGRTPFTYAGHTWYADDAAVADMDRTMSEAFKRHIVVSAIILINKPGNAPAGSFTRLVAHPDATADGIYAMPNLTTEEGVAAYAAALDFLAERYSRLDGKYGRIHHWIMHNEVNSGWVWTNAGEKSALLYMDLYHRSMRMAQLIARQYDPHAKAFISLDHHWTAKNDAHCYAGRELLDDLLQFSAAEGDFDWAIAHHPYPQDLGNPRVWVDNQVTFSFATPKITFKNLEVLDAWVRQPRVMFKGKTPRTIHLTEQGLNSRDYSEKSLRDQAVGMAYAWNKYKTLPAIEAFQYHNWVDNRDEGGLRIGLRKFPDEPGDPLGKKPIWTVYEALGTPREAEATAFAKDVIGIKDWSEVRHVGEIK